MQLFNINKFRATLALRNETQADAAKVMGVNPSTLFRKMRGQNEFSRKEIELFCNYYKVDPREIFFSNISAYKQREMRI